MVDLHRCLLKPDQPLSEALRLMNGNGARITILVDDEQHLKGIITDWDIRNALLNGNCLDDTIDQFMNTKPVVAPIGLDTAEYLAILKQNGNECLPLIDEENRVVDLFLIRDMVEKTFLPSSMMIMAGGAGKRLWPLTKDTPKPLLPVADKPLLEHILNHAKGQGIEDVWISTHYQSEKIEAFLDTSTPDGMDAQVLREEMPLGTAGALKLFEGQNPSGDKPILIMNGDILTTLNFQSLLEWHTVHDNILTVCSQQYSFQVPYGVLKTDGQNLVEVNEKPVEVYNVNAGIYLVDRKALSYIPENVHFDMTDLIDALIAQDLKVGTFPISEPWIDIGKHQDYERVNQESEKYLSPETLTPSM